MFQGVCAEGTASKYGITREDQDNYAQASYTRSRNAWEVIYENSVLCINTNVFLL